MIRFIELLISVLITVALFVVIALFLPSHARVVREVELGAPMTQVYDSLNHFKRFNAWNPFYPLDTRAKYELEGNEYGEGAKIRWNSILEKQVGQGSLEITESVPEERIVMNLENNWRGNEKTYTFDMEQNPQTNAVKLRWAMDVDYGWNLFGRYAGLYLNGRVGELMNEGLGRFASMLATVPNYDYSQIEIQLRDVAPVDLVYVGIGVPAAPVQWPEAEAAMETAWTEVEQFITRNKLQALGPRRRIVNQLGEENHDFNLAIPVAPHTAQPTGNVKLGQGYAGRALWTQFRGHRVGLSRPRDMLKAYALTHGNLFDRDLVGLWEEWLPPEPVPEDAPFAPDPLTDVYLPIR